MSEFLYFIGHKKKSNSNDHLKVGTDKEVPLDCSEPSLQDIVPAKTCDCDIYHGTNKTVCTLD